MSSCRAYHSDRCFIASTEGQARKAGIKRIGAFRDDSHAISLRRHGLRPESLLSIRLSITTSFPYSAAVRTGFVAVSTRLGRVMTNPEAWVSRKLPRVSASFSRFAGGSMRLHEENLVCIARRCCSIAELCSAARVRVAARALASSAPFRASPNARFNRRDRSLTGVKNLTIHIAVNTEGPPVSVLSA